jgi:hypothetical protein
VVNVTPGVVRTDLAAGFLATPSGEADTAAATALARVAEPEGVTGSSGCCARFGGGRSEGSTPLVRGPCVPR